MIRWLSSMVLLASALLGVVPAPAHAAGPTSCTLEFSLEGWEAIVGRTARSTIA
jgi:hypothetical protein